MSVCIITVDCFYEYMAVIKMSYWSEKGADCMSVDYNWIVVAANVLCKSYY